jgi:hypothetical protein
MQDLRDKGEISPLTMLNHSMKMRGREGEEEEGQGESATGGSIHLGV